jgi:tol-pal system protein YbgF
MNRALLRTAPLAFVMLLAAPAMAQELAPLLDRLDRLERDIRTLNIQVSRGEAPAAAAAIAGAAPAKPGQPVADFAAQRLGQRIDTLEFDLRAVTGAQENLNHQIRKLGERLDKLVGDVDYRLGVIENRLGISGGQALTQAIGATSSAPPPAPAGAAGTPPATIAAAPEPKALPPTAQPPGATGGVAAAKPAGNLGTVSAQAVKSIEQSQGGAPAQAPAATQPAQGAAAPAASQAGALPAGSAKDQYTYAFNLLRQTNYDQAEIALKEFIKVHGDNPLAGNARYWLGETFYVRADYQQAAQVFFEGFQADPKGAKAPDMLLKLGMSLNQLGKKKEACATYGKVAADFGKSAARINNALARERERAGCQ